MRYRYHHPNPFHHHKTENFHLFPQLSQRLFLRITRLRTPPRLLRSPSSAPSRHLPLPSPLLHLHLPPKTPNTHRHRALRRCHRNQRPDQENLHRIQREFTSPIPASCATPDVLFLPSHRCYDVVSEIRRIPELGGGDLLAMIMGCAWGAELGFGGEGFEEEGEDEEAGGGGEEGVD